MEATQVEVPASPARPVELRPFRGVRLSPQKVANPATARAFSRPYRDVARRLVHWQDEGFVDLDVTPALYLHEYTVHQMTIRGLVGGLELSTRATDDDVRTVHAHEAIHPDQADELAERMQEMGINPAPIILVHHGPQAIRDVQAEIMAWAPEHDYVDRAGQHHRLWRVTEDSHLDTINTALADARLMIADGHHRYAAYLRLQAQHPGTPWDRGLTMVVDQDDTPFFLGPIHRTFPGRTLDDLADAARRSGVSVDWVEEAAGLQALQPRTLVATDGTRWLTVSLPADEEASPVEMLHTVLLSDVSSEGITHHHTVEEALAAATPTAVAVLLPAPDYSLLDRAMDQGQLLPEKATSFQPKPSLGVLMRSVDSELMAPPTRL